LICPATGLFAAGLLGLLLSGCGPQANRPTAGNPTTDGYTVRTGGGINDVPMPPADQGAVDLRSVAGQGHYTLQIGYFEDPNDPALARQTAEQWAGQLRSQGTAAYYFHGPNRSMVTVGVFPANAASVSETGVVTYSPAVRQLQQQFPHNLYNGNTIRVKLRDGRTIDQPSFLVRIPSR
jgi:hypothetical protein